MPAPLVRRSTDTMPFNIGFDVHPLLGFRAVLKLEDLSFKCSEDAVDLSLVTRDNLGG